MPISIVGRKCGMTRVFTEDGASIPVTVIAVEPNRVTQVKTPETDGYWGVQVTTGQRDAKHVNKPIAGHFKKAGVEAGRGLWEFRLDVTEVKEDKSPWNVGDVLDATRFAVGQIVDVTAVSRGKGYAGTIKRWNFKSQRASHGNSVSHRAPGSIGQNQTPGRVFKGKKMSGHLGNERCTVQNQEVIRVDGEKGLLLLKGAVPGAPGGNVIIKPAIKDKKKGNQ